MPNIYTTPKMIAAGVTADVVWQGLCQFVDPLLENDDVGAMAAVDFTNYIAYPIGLTIFTAVVFCPGYRKYSGKEKEETQAILANVFFSLLGWMSGYYIATEQEMGRVGIASFAGLGSALSLMCFNYAYDKAQGNETKTKTFAAAMGVLAISGFLWSIAYDLPRDMKDTDMPEWSKGLFACALTAACSAVTLLALKYYEVSETKKEKKAPVA